MASTRKKCTWSPRKMKTAINAVHQGAKLRQTASLYNIPVMTLSDYVKKSKNSHSVIFSRMGRKPVFSEQQENEIKEHILLLSRKFYGLTPHSLKSAVYEYAEHNKIKHPFNTVSKQAGKDWLYGFLKRNPDISIRRPEATSVNRILAFNSQEVSSIFNVDETGINSVHRPGQILAQKGLKQVGSATSWERGKNITICFCISATGQYIPPMIIYPRQRMQAHLHRGGPNGSIYRCSKSGWMVEELFYDWLVHFKEQTVATPENPVLLILDNHTSHISLQIYNYCRDSGIHMVTLTPHTSHRTQPLDLTVFGPLKNALHKECQMYMNINNYEKLTPVDLIPLFTKAYYKIANAEKAINGFRAAGIWPLDSNIFEQLTEEGNEGLGNDYISAEEALNLENEAQHLSMNNPDDIQSSTSAENEPIQQSDPRNLSVTDPEAIQPCTSGVNKPIQQSESRNLSVTDPEAIQPSTSGVNEPIQQSEPRNLSVTDPDDVQPSTSGENNPIQLEEDVAQEIIVLYTEPIGEVTTSKISSPNMLRMEPETNLREDQMRIDSFKENVERVKRQVFEFPESPAHVPFSTISPMPDKNNKQEKRKEQGKRSKQHSIILTSTPMKTLLENKEKKRTIKKEKEDKAKDIKKQKTQKNNSNKIYKNTNNEQCKKKIKRRENDSTSEVKENLFCDDDDDYEGRFYDERQSQVDELCVICDEFGKNGELWFRCVSCGKWVHALCSGEDSAENYLCALCE